MTVPRMASRCCSTRSSSPFGRHRDEDDDAVYAVALDELPAAAAQQAQEAAFAEDFGFVVAHSARA